MSSFETTSRVPMRWKTVASVPESFGLEKAKEVFKSGLYWSCINLKETDKTNVYEVGNKRGFFPNMKLEIKKGRITIKRQVAK